jgi:uncharacterized membrane protein YgdD (TMEM256/DUF423 family)
MEKKFFALGAFLAGVAVGTGAYGAHGLHKLVPPERWTAWEKAVRYQMYHAFALMFVAWAMVQWVQQAKKLNAAGWSFLAGIALFSGSLYIRVFTGDLQTEGFTGIDSAFLTPLGGILMMLGWFLLAWAAWEGNSK